MVLYLPNFSLVFLIHVFLYAGVYCIFKTLEGVGSQDITNNLFIPFGSPAVMKSNESKFNHKAKVTIKE